MAFQEIIKQELKIIQEDLKPTHSVVILCLTDDIRHILAIPDILPDADTLATLGAPTAQLEGITDAFRKNFPRSSSI